jgi:hypothetical protein
MGPPRPGPLHHAPREGLSKQWASSQVSSGPKKQGRSGQRKVIEKLLLEAQAKLKKDEEDHKRE